MKYFLGTLFLLAVVVWLGVKDSFTPIQRTEINQPILTIGDANYQQALSDGKNIVKFGKMFWGFYPGGMAFSTPDEAIEFIRSNQSVLDKFSSGWEIYELSGDFTLDTWQVGDSRYLNKSLLVIKRVNKP